MLQEQGSRHAGQRVETAGWAAAFETGGLYLLVSGYFKALVSAFDEVFGNVHAFPGYHLSRTGQDFVAVAADQIGGYARGGKTAELFRTDRNPM